MVIQTLLHLQDDSLNHHQIGQHCAVTSDRAPEETFLQQLLSYGRRIQHKQKACKGRTCCRLCRGRRLPRLAKLSRIHYRRYCPAKPEDRRSLRKQNFKAEKRSGYPICKLLPEVCVFRNIISLSKQQETIRSHVPQLTVVWTCGLRQFYHSVKVSEDNDNCTGRNNSDSGLHAIHPTETSARVARYDIVEVSERSGGTVIKQTSYHSQLQTAYRNKQSQLEEIRHLASSWSTHLPVPISSDTLTLEQPDHLLKDKTFHKANRCFLDNRDRRRLVSSWSPKHREFIRFPNELDRSRSAASGCFSNNNANAAHSSVAPVPCHTIVGATRSQYPLIISNSYSPLPPDPGVEARKRRGNPERHLSTYPQRHPVYFCAEGILDLDLTPVSIATHHRRNRAPSVTSSGFESGRYWWEAQSIYSARANKVRSESPKVLQEELTTGQNFPKVHLHSEEFSLNHQHKGCDFTKGKHSFYCCSPRDMGCIQSIAKAKVSPDRCNHHCVIVEDIQAAIDKVATEIEEKSDIVLRYKTPYFRASAQVIVPPIPKKETWTIGWIQACDSMKFINEYGNLGSSSWEIPALKERKISAVSDSDGVSYPWYGNTTEIASIEGPTDTSRSILLRMNDNFHPSVTWDIPVSEGSEAHLTHIVRDQSFTTWLAAVNQTTGRLEVLRTVKWHFFLEIDVDPTEKLGHRAQIVSPPVQQQPMILKNNSDPVYLSHGAGNDRQHKLEKRIRNGGDNNSNNHLNFIPKSALVRPSANNAQTLIWRPTRNSPIVVVPPKEVYRENNEVIWFSNANGPGPNVKILSQRETTQLSKSMDS